MEAKLRGRGEGGDLELSFHILFLLWWHKDTTQPSVKARKPISIPPCTCWSVVVVVVQSKIFADGFPVEIATSPPYVALRWIGLIESMDVIFSPLLIALQEGLLISSSLSSAGLFLCECVAGLSSVINLWPRERKHCLRQVKAEEWFQQFGVARLCWLISLILLPPSLPCFFQAGVEEDNCTFLLNYHHYHSWRREERKIEAILVGTQISDHYLKAIVNELRVTNHRASLDGPPVLVSAFSLGCLYRKTREQFVSYQVEHSWNYRTEQA